MKKRLLPSTLALALTFAVPATVLLAQSAPPKSAAQLQADQIRELEQFLAVYKKVKSSYVDKVDDKQLMEGAIQGMLASLDPHSGFLNKSDFSSLQTQIDGEYGGLGLSVTLEDEAVKVIAPTKDTPADKAGIKSGDYITHLDGKLIFGGTLDEAVEAMRGEPGTSIKLTIVRPGRDAPFDVTITRAIIDLKPVRWEVKDRIGLITITGFSEETGADVVAAVSSIKKSLGGKPLGYIVDLRSNPGGILDEAVAVSDAFLASGEIVSERGRDKRDIERWWAERAVPGDVTGGAPIIVLVDAGSASASEIVAGALQDHHRGLVMGERSFGKGSVQNVLPLTRDTGLRLTVARYHLPSGRSVQEGGIKPDIQVPQLSDPDYKKRVAIRESDLRRHLINEMQDNAKELEEDIADDPRFALTAEQLKAKGITDFQLHYAMETLNRLGTKTMKLAEKPVKGKAQN
ncbi:MAG TPA: S41 family peptidase [Sphingorhabdus lacus]|uniref:S41 family peptidase n=1 Tax=Sphingorhabdus lacus TaxID=392610 RepID=A0A6I6LH15_9SPHN|nr:S41 family peptidase [Sphingorhabdus lacus]QGY81622.1 S41 family peptidase [Sphingorhabdus lacus]HNW17077.1 S41 family peptidase [Sphingorhabdus lacus]HPV66664.1 S41 family peptidase [Sphingorhabdus lacus]